ncbi:unnamed protein product, partial [Ectocarpus fasciculatus]
VLKAVVAKYNAEELLSKRESVSTRIRDELTHRAKQFHLIMDDVSITHLTFGHEFTKAIENKQVCMRGFDMQNHVLLFVHTRLRFKLLRFNVRNNNGGATMPSFIDSTAAVHTIGFNIACATTTQVAQQEAERQVYVVALSDQERLAAIIRAEGEAEAAELISAALKESGIGLIEVRRIDTAKEIALTLATSRNITYLPTGGGSNMLLGLNTA